MTVESERGTSDRGVDAESTPTPKDTRDNSIDAFYAYGSYEDDDHDDGAQDGASYGGAYNRVYDDIPDDHADDSPERLRTRADSLLDEMMLGAVDVSAADFSGADAGSSQHDWDYSSGYAFEHDPSEDNAAEAATDGYGTDRYGADGSSRPSYSASNGNSTANGSYGSFDANGRDSTSPSTTGSQNGSWADYGTGANGSDAGYSRNGHDTAGERPPSTYASDGYSSAGSPSTNHSRSGTSYSSNPSEPDGASSGVTHVQRQNGYTPEEASTPTPTPEWRVMSGGGGSANDSSTWTDYVSAFRSPSASYDEASGQAEKWQPDSPADGYTPPRRAADTERDDAGSDRSSGAYTGSTSGATASSQTGYAGERSADRDADRSEDLGYVSAMSVMPKGPRRSALLPRMSRFDVDALNREIAELHEEIRILLPVGHDQSERAQHLLDKANTIAASDPQRSAEVEYYMQQVRTIVERTRQSRRWSNLYRDRLRTYLLAWAVLATMTLTALLLSQFQIEAVMAGLVDAARDGVFMRNFAGALGAMMAGALGGALGALINMGKHARSQYGFFDRKYGLRGLMLPIIGALVGIVVYSLFAVVYYLAGINPSLSAVAMATPALLAFVFGFSQESLYGTTS